MYTINPVALHAAIVFLAANITVTVYNTKKPPCKGCGIHTTRKIEGVVPCCANCEEDGLVQVA